MPREGHSHVGQGTSEVDGNRLMRKWSSTPSAKPTGRSLIVGTILVAILGLACPVSASGSQPSAIAQSTKAASGLAVDRQVVTHQSSLSSSISSPPLSTSQAGELILAFVTSGGSDTTKQAFSSVTGGGLNWQLRQRSNAQGGTSEIWQAVAPTVVTDLVVKANRANGRYAGSLVVTAFIGASTAVNGATKTASGSRGTPTATLTPTMPGSWVWGVGNDWDRAAARTVGPNQSMVDEYLSPFADTFWVQRQSAPSSTASTAPVTINDTAPAEDRWNLALIEVLPTNPTTPTDTTAPVMSAVSVSAISATQATINWTTSEPANGSVAYGPTTTYASTAATNSSMSTSHSQVLSGLTAGTTYHYQVRSADAAGNLATSVDAIFKTSTPADTTPPTVTVTAPANGSNASGTVALNATAADNVGVTGVQFQVDGTNVGAVDATAPYSVLWDTTTATNGTHTIGAVARDAAGNTRSAGKISVAVNNPSGGGTFNPGNPSGNATVPAGMGVEDISQPDRVVGDGTPASCTSAAVVSAVAAGGVVTFNCGPNPITVTLTQTLKVRNSTQKLVIDGGGKVTLSGGNANRILYIDTCDTSLGTVSGNCLYAPSWPQVTVQNITLADGNATNSSFVSPGDSNGRSNGGGAIFALGGRLKVVNSVFVRNICATNGPDLGGAAIRVLAQHSATPNDLDASSAARNQDPVYIVGSTFGGSPDQGNNCSNGGAISGLRTPITVLNSLITYNNAIGCCANPAWSGTPGGGSGGAIYTDGTSYDLRIAGTSIEKNTAKAGGSAIFYVSNDRTGRLYIDSSTIKGNTYAPNGLLNDPHFESFPGIYYQGVGNSPVFTNSTIQ